MRQALEMALEALQKIYIAPEHEEYIRVWWPACEQAITAIKEALAQPEQEPVAYLCKRDDGHFDVLTDQTCTKCFAVYTHPKSEQDEKFCDNNCVWTDHHPDCVRANKPEPVGFVVDRYNGANTPSLPPTAMVAWLNDNPKIGQVLYTTPQPDKLAYYEKVADDLQVLCDKQSLRIAELEAQPKQEPVAWINEHELKVISENVTPTVGHRKLDDDDVPLYTTPPQRKPLTDQQIEQLFPEALSDDGLASYWLTFARAIEAAHGIKE